MAHRSHSGEGQARPSSRLQKRKGIPRSQSLLNRGAARCTLEGYEEGYKAGLAEGKARADQEAARLLNLLRDFVDKAAADRANALAKLEEDFLKLSLILAEKIVRNTIKDDPAWLKPVIEEACQKLGTVDECIVRLSPVEYEALKDQELRLGGARVERLSLRPDPTLKPGDCVIETESGTVDASLEKRLGKLAEHLLEVIYDGQNALSQSKLLRAVLQVSTTMST